MARMTTRDTLKSGIMHLTKHEPDVGSVERDRPADEIEVTPAMIEAGWEAWVDALYNWAPERDALASAFRAMLSRREAEAKASAIGTRQFCGENKADALHRT